METTAPSYVALMATRGRLVGLALAPEPLWQDLYGLRMLRLEFPSAAHLPPEDAHSAALALSSAIYGCEAAPLPTPWTFGPSPRHAIDRVATTTPATAPLLRFERMFPMDDESGVPPRIGIIHVYRAELAGDPIPHPETTAGVVLLPLAALRQLVRGLRVGDALRLDGVTTYLVDGMNLPDDGMFYLPSDFGERLSLRVAAKYGARALFPTPAGDTTGSE